MDSRLTTLVLAAADDRAVLAWAARDPQVRLVTPNDLRSPGWTWRDDGTVTARDAHGLVDVSEVRGVVTRLPAVPLDHLTWVRDADRAYAAAECTAFLTAWLASVDVPVVNRPRGGALCGDVNPYAIAAAAHQLKWRTRWTPTRTAEPAEFFDVDEFVVHSVAGEIASRHATTTGGAVPEGRVRPPAADPSAIPGLAESVRSLARAVGLPLLRVRLGVPTGGAGEPIEVRGVDAWVDIGCAEVAAAVTDLLDSETRPDQYSGTAIGIWAS